MSMPLDFGPGSDLSGQGVEGRTPPPQRFLDWLHGRASTERPDDIHHKLGFGENDAASGSHVHDGVDSLPLWRTPIAPLVGTEDLAGVRAKLNEVIAALNEKSG